MKEALKHYTKNYFVNIGDKKLSPVSQVSIGLCMEYIEAIQKEDSTVQNPFFVCFPNKKWATVWVSLGLLNHFFLEDYVYQKENKLEGLKRGDRISIFGKLSIWNGDNTLSVNQSYSDAYGKTTSQITYYTIPDCWKPHINKDKTSRKRIISMTQLKRELKTRRGKRTALDKILTYNEKRGLGVNPNVLKSEILIVTGRGDKGNFIKQIKETKIHEESLCDIFQLGENLKIEVDLSNYKMFFDDKLQGEYTSYCKLAKEVFLKLGDSDKVFEITTSNLKGLIDKDMLLSEEYILQFKKLISGLGKGHKNYKQLLYLQKNYPNNLPSFPSNLKLVIINDIQLFYEFEKTIKGFLKKNIPVIILSDRFMSDSSNESFYNDLFTNHPNSYRYNWNKKKISNLIEFEEKEVDYLDSSLWKSCKRYSKQEIIITDKGSNQLDEIFYKIPQLVYSIEGHEILKRAYWKYLYPLSYIYKNSPDKINKSVGSYLLDSFKEILEEMKDVLERDFLNAINSMMEVFSSEFINCKNIDSYDSNIFSQKISLENFPRLRLPDLKGSNKTTYILNDKIEKICFTGEPYRERSLNYLSRAISSHFIPRIEILTWTKESQKVYTSLKRYLLSSYFKDHLIKGMKIKSSTSLKDKDEFNNEIEETLKVKLIEPKQSDKEIEEIENISYQISMTRHSKYTDNESTSYLIKCSVINFNDGSWMYLPTGSSIYGIVMNTNNERDVKKYKLNQLSVGMDILQYSLPLSDLRDMARADEKLEVKFDILDKWRRSLKNVCLSCAASFLAASKMMNEVKRKNSFSGNPSVSNITRWTYDDELLAPEEDNLKIILTTDNRIEKLGEILMARKFIDRFNSQIRKKIKTQTIEKLKKKALIQSDEFMMTTNNCKITINVKNISSIESKKLTVRYSETKKIIFE